MDSAEIQETIRLAPRSPYYHEWRRQQGPELARSTFRDSLIDNLLQMTPDELLTVATAVDNYPATEEQIAAAIFTRVQEVSFIRPESNEGWR